MKKSDLASIKIPKSWHWKACKFHLVGKIIDGEETLVASKRWLKYRQQWDYHLETIDHLRYKLAISKAD